MFGLGKSRFPKVSFKTERPFMVGTAITFGLVTWLHYSIYKDGTSAPLGTSRTSSSLVHSQTHRHDHRPSPSGPVPSLTCCGWRRPPRFRSGSLYESPQDGVTAPQDDGWQSRRSMGGQRWGMMLSPVLMRAPSLTIIKTRVIMMKKSVAHTHVCAPVSGGEIKRNCPKFVCA